MPLSKSDQKRMDALKKEYGEKKGERIAYAMENKEKSRKGGDGSRKK